MRFHFAVRAFDLAYGHGCSGGGTEGDLRGTSGEPRRIIGGTLEEPWWNLGDLGGCFEEP